MGGEGIGWTPALEWVNSFYHCEFDVSLVYQLSVVWYVHNNGALYSVVELRPFFIKILVWTSFVYFVQSWSQNTSLDTNLKEEEKIYLEAVKSGFCNRFDYSL